MKAKASYVGLYKSLTNPALEKEKPGSFYMET